MASARRLVGELQEQTSAASYFLFKKGHPRGAYSHIFSKLMVRNVGPALLDPLYRLRPEFAPYPREIEVEVTTRCHLRCVMCEHTHWSEKAQDLSFEDFKMIVDQFPSLRFIGPTGEGSSFLNSRYLDMLAYARSRGAFIKVVESLTNISKEQMKEIIRIGVNRIVCSLDGATKETYEGIRKGASLNTVISNVATLLDLKKSMNSPLPDLTFRFIIMTTNYRELPQFIRLVRSFGAGDSINIVGTLDFPEIEPLSIADKREYLEEVARIAREECIQIPLGPTMTLGPITKCSMWVQPYFMIGGYVLPCCGVLMSNRRDYLRKYALGNIYEKPFREIWDSEAYRALRASVPRREGPLHPLCVDCRSFDTFGRTAEGFPGVA